jgi:hypothetical protein
MPAEHELKTLAPYWDALQRGEKNFEVRRDDRGFQKGDVLLLHRMRPGRPADYDCHPHDGSKKTLRRKITYILTGGQLGVEPGYVVLGLRKA